MIALGREPAAKRAYAEIKTRISDNLMPAGNQYLEAELADLLGMSRTPVREACVRLAEEGMLEIRPRHGIRVLPISADDMAEIYQILTALEATAARAVAAKPASAEEIALLENAVSAMDDALAADDLARWAEEDKRFHKLLVDLSGNARLSTVVSMFWDQAHRARVITLRMRAKPIRSNHDHRAVVEAIRSGDAEAAETIHRKHREESGRMLVALLRRFGLRQV
jgi:DNA-binding GntR family transcriptional regulator